LIVFSFTFLYFHLAYVFLFAEVSRTTAGNEHNDFPFELYASLYLSACMYTSPS